MTEIQAAKCALRREMLERREKMTREETIGKSVGAQMKLLACAAWQKASSIALYASCKGELSTYLLLEQAWRTGKKVYLPKVTDGRHGEMKFFSCAGSQSLEKGAFGIPEPVDGVEMEAPDLMICPGLAYDRAGHRLGYGGGYYDRFLAAKKDFPVIGLCFAWQILPEIPHVGHDKTVSGLCAEECLIWL